MNNDKKPVTHEDVGPGTFSDELESEINEHIAEGWVDRLDALAQLEYVEYVEGRYYWTEAGLAIRGANNDNKQSDEDGNGNGSAQLPTGSALVGLEQWSVEHAHGSQYLAPEVRPVVLVGTCYGHPKHTDGKRIQSAVIVSAKGLIITTASGTVYELGQIHPHYEAYLRENKIAFDPANPVTVKRG